MDLYPTYHPTGEVQVLQKAWKLLSDDVKASLQRAESNLNALNTVDLGPKRPFSVGECALWARLTGPQFAAQVAAVVSLVEAPPVNHCKATTAEAAVAAAEAISVADLNKTKRLAAEFEALGSGALTMALAQEAEPGDPLRECWLALERLRVSETRSISYKEILMACTDAAAEAAAVSAAEAAAAEAAAAEAAAAVEAVAAAEAAAAVESAAAAGGAAKAAADAPGAEAALAPELPKEPGGGADGMAEGAEETPGRPVFSVGALEELKTRGGSVSSEKANAAAQAERSTPIKLHGNIPA